MIMTEEEAKKKWCPFVRLTVGVIEGKGGQLTPAFNRFGSVETGLTENPVDCRCIASECMAWRWARIEEVRPTATWDGPKFNEDTIPIHEHPLTSAKYVGTESGRRVATPRGSCGLAGKSK